MSVTTHSIEVLDRRRLVFQRVTRRDPAKDWDRLTSRIVSGGRLVTLREVQALRMMWFGGLREEQIADSAGITVEELRRMAVAGGWRRGPA